VQGPQSPAVPPGNLRRSLSLWQTTVSGVGIMIGAGIYVLVGEAAAHAGSLLWAAFLLAALVAACTGLGYAELAGMFPSAGAESEFARRAFGDVWGFLAGWLMATGNAIAAGAVALGFATYLREFIDINVSLAAVAMLLALLALVVSGIERSIWVSTALAMLQVGGLLIVIVAGAPEVGSRPLTEGSLAGVLAASSLVFFAFIGFDEVVTLSEETREAARVIPRALLLSLAVSAILYAVVGVVAVSAVDWRLLASSERPLALVLHSQGGAGASTVVVWIALASTLNTTLLLLTAASRIVFSLASREWLPPLFSQVGRRSGAPQLAAGAVAAGACATALGGDIEIAAALTDFTVFVEFLAVNLALLRLRRILPAWPRPITVRPGAREWPIPTLVGLVTAGVMLMLLPPLAWFVGCAIAAAGVMTWFGRMQRGDRAPSGGDS